MMTQQSVWCLSRQGGMSAQGKTPNWGILQSRAFGTLVSYPVCRGVAFSLSCVYPAPGSVPFHDPLELC